jgi:hypothetical protein
MDAAARLLEDIAFEKAWPYPLVQGIKKAAHERTMEDHAIHVNGLEAKDDHLSFCFHIEGLESDEVITSEEITQLLREHCQACFFPSRSFSAPHPSPLSSTAFPPWTWAAYP